MTDYIKITSIKSEFISVGWYLGSLCNYNCSYCLERYHDGKHKFPDDLNGIKKFIIKLKNKYPKKLILFTIYGGEPTLWKLCREFSELCKKYDAYIRIVSNGSKDLKWWEENEKHFYNIIISYHYQFADKNHILELMKILKNKSQINLMMPVKKEEFDDLLEIGKWISETAKVFVLPKYLRVDMGHKLYDYDSDQIKIFKYKPIGVKYLPKEDLFWYRGFKLTKSNGREQIFSNCRKIFLENINRWKGWRCWGGIDSFFINQEGNIYIGQCRKGMFGNLDGEYDLPDEPFICPKDICNCSQDIIDCNKEKI